MLSNGTKLTTQAGGYLGAKLRIVQVHGCVLVLVVIFVLKPRLAGSLVHSGDEASTSPVSSTWHIVIAHGTQVLLAEPEKWEDGLTVWLIPRLYGYSNCSLGCRRSSRSPSRRKPST
ncbi:hypothetical protein LCI18_014556 [Fusarium solani-melongenae]|uniref:Uncharacterized protein n=1 Tax=Fusarium solani subsp. cucurbitae TaxID=2747967 RepID=A0ACD3ZRA9_FUSSC|nr:hypothetical protein LCI18_014556 [Fusarium solani-melongenae]